jgi:hypothetical protein
MRKLGKLAILTFAEYESLMCRTEDAEAHAADFAEELDRVRSNYEIDVLDAFNAGKFHAAGGYSHTLPKLKEQLADATALFERWRPLVETLETTKGQFTGMP